jgi:hypothetical protein
MCWPAQTDMDTNKSSKLSYISDRGKKDVHDRSDVKVGDGERERSAVILGAKV